MARFMALLIGAAQATEKASVPAEVSERFIQAWGEWHTAYAAAVVESGSPLGANRRVTHDRTEAVANQLVAWMVVEAQSADDATAMLAHHPHVALLPGNAIDVMELSLAPSAK